MIDRRQELRGQTFFANSESGFHPLCPGFELAYLCVAKRTHSAKLHPEHALAEEFLPLDAGSISLAWRVPFDKGKVIQQHPESLGAGLDAFRWKEPNHYDREIREFLETLVYARLV